MRLSLFLYIAVAGIALSAEARAAAGRDYEVTYFAEAQLRTYVGTFFKPCGTGGATLTGRRSRYFIKSQSSCLIIGSHSPVSLSCHFTQKGCTDALAHGFRIVPSAPGFNSSAGSTPSLFQPGAADRELLRRNRRASGIKGL